MNKIQEGIDKCWSEGDQAQLFRFRKLKHAFEIVKELEEILPKDAYRHINALVQIIHREITNGE